MKRITIIILAVAAILAGSVSCQKVNYIDLTNDFPEPPTNGLFEAVDLGLSVKWANMNLGASTPSASGGYYAWGATEPYFSGPYDNPTSWIKEGGYIWRNAPFNGGSSEFNSSYFSEHKSDFLDENDVLLPKYDAAHVKLGNGWRMPTAEEFDELFKHTGKTIPRIGNVMLLTFTSQNGNSISLPMQGYYDGTNYIFNKYGGYQQYKSYYWSSTHKIEKNKDTKYAQSLYVTFTSWYMLGQDIQYGCLIRPVYDESQANSHR